MIVRLALVGCFLASPLVMSHAATHAAWIPAAALIAAMQGFVASRALPSRWRAAGGIVCTLLPPVLVLAFPRTIVMLWPGILQGVIYAVLLAVFARTLRPGRTPLVSRFAILMRGALPPEIDRYTRRVTLAWCLFFAAEITASILLLAFAPYRQWLFFVSVATWPLVAVMFLGEYAYRRYRLRHYRLETLADMMRLFTLYRADPARFRA
jgi:uncharacterized membrane protein